MAKITIAFGTALIVLGFAGFILTGSEHYTALIPALFGVLFEVCGVLALNPKLRMHAMHAAAMLGLLGFFGSVPGIIKSIKWAAGTAPERPAAVIAQLIMALLCVGFVVLCVMSFIQARRNRQAAAGAPVDPTSSARP